MENDEFRKIKDVAGFCKIKVPYYQNLLSRFELNSVSDFGKIPLLTNKIYCNHTPPVSNSLLSREASGCFVFSSGGTTTEPRYILRDFADFDYQIQDYEGLNLGPNDTVINLFMPGLWGIFTSVNITLIRLGCRIIPFGGANLTEKDKHKIADLIGQFRANTLLGVPSTILAVARFLFLNSHYQAICPLVNKIFTLGEEIRLSSLRFIRQVFPNAVIKSKYGTMESAGIAYQCRYLDRNHYHPFHNRFVEIVDTNSNQSLSSGKKGLIVVTTLNPRLIPLIRFSTGDIGWLFKKSCPCGEKQILKIGGRLQDMVISASVHFSLDQIESIISSFSELNPPVVFQIEITNPQGIDEIILRIETPKVTRRLKKEVLKKLYQEITDIPEALFSGKILRFEIDFVAIGSISRIPSTGKIKKIVDLRK